MQLLPRRFVNVGDRDLFLVRRVRNRLDVVRRCGRDIVHRRTRGGTRRVPRDRWRRHRFKLVRCPRVRPRAVRNRVRDVVFRRRPVKRNGCSMIRLSLRSISVLVVDCLRDRMRQL